MMGVIGRRIQALPIVDFDLSLIRLQLCLHIRMLPLLHPLHGFPLDHSYQHLVHRLLLSPLLLSPLSSIPGPKLYAFTKWRLARDDWGQRTRTIHALHKKYGPVVRIGPNEVYFNSVSALRTI
jgi:hypothetical protein